MEGWKKDIRFESGKKRLKVEDNQNRVLGLQVIAFRGTIRVISLKVEMKEMEESEGSGISVSNTAILDAQIPTCHAELKLHR